MSRPLKFNRTVVVIRIILKYLLTKIMYTVRNVHTLYSVHCTMYRVCTFQTLVGHIDT